MRVWLASASQRRCQWLNERLSHVECHALEGINENIRQSTVGETVREICRIKANAVPKNHGYDLVIVSDTLVEDPDDEAHALGKPMNKEEALRMLLRIRGSTHKVWTATAALENGNWKFSLEHAVVKIDYFSDDVLVELIETESWKGKAGGYDLAGQMGKYAYLVKGSESVVLGLSIEPFKHLLRKT